MTFAGGDIPLADALEKVAAAEDLVKRDLEARRSGRKKIFYSPNT